MEISVTFRAPYLQNLANNTASFFMRRHRSVNLQPSLHTVDNYRPRARARAHICAFGIQTRATASPVVDPYRLIDGDSRVGNPIHWAEDKFHVPQCVSKWGRGRMIRRVAVLVRLRLHRETMASMDLCTRVYV